jgi:Transposase DNA-binding/Transposase Tn5 dimerisation domain
MQPWIEQELRTVRLADEHLNSRYRVLLDRLSSKPTLSIPAACKGWAETQAAYRFFDNDRILPEHLLRPHYDATLARIGQHPVVLIPQDTTEFDLTRPQEKIGGPLGDEKHWGLHTHVALAVTPERLALGVVHHFTWARNPEDFPKRSPARYKPIEAKESYRWLEGYQRAGVVAAQCPKTMIVCLSDSEGDIYECLAAADPVEGPKAEWIVRACQDRSLAGETAGKLRASVASCPTLGTLKIEVSARPAQSHDGSKRRQARHARTATVTVHACRVMLQAPWRPGPKLADVAVNAVLVCEVDPPSGEPALEWLLLSSLPVDTFAQVCTVIHYYSCRWEIEVFFRVLKSGCTVEELQLETVERFTSCLALYLIVAWRVRFVMRLGRECPEMPCEAVFTEAEWRAVYQIVKRQPATAIPSLGELLLMIAEWGGYLNRKHDGPAGPQTIWIGLQRARDFALAWSVFTAPNAPPSCVER